jgi:hypothetical protein
MRRNVVKTDARGRSFQLAGLLLVGACVCFILLHALTHADTSTSGAGAKQVAESGIIERHDPTIRSHAFSAAPALAVTRTRH